jgi:ATP-binding cassette subfamily B protein
VDKIREFLSFREELVSGNEKADARSFASLEAQNVSFGYDSDKQILKGINLEVRQGEKIAIVGYNGAGKTTFIKLLMHLYDVSGGAILLNGRDIREYESKG